MNWEFTPDEFMHVWRETRTDRYPFPLRLRASTRWQDDHTHHTEELATRLPYGANPTLTTALRTAAAPAISLSLTGTRHHPLRAYAAIDAHLAITMVQRPGPTPDIGANIVIETGTPALVPKVFAAALGTTPAGRTLTRPESVNTREPEPAYPTRSPKSLSAQPNSVHHLLTLPRSSQGHIEARHPDATPEYLSWFDIPDDGRYSYRLHHDRLHVSPCAPSDLISELTHMCRPPIRCDR